MNATSRGPSLAPAVRIRAALPDDGTDRHLMEQLRQEFGITRMESVAVRAVAALQQARTRTGRLPEARAARLVTIVVDAPHADDVFDFVFSAARIDRPGGGFATMDRLQGATMPEPPAGPADESRADDSRPRSGHGSFASSGSASLPSATPSNSTVDR
jgi:hypothetical protein